MLHDSKLTLSLPQYSNARKKTQNKTRQNAMFLSAQWINTRCCSVLYFFFCEWIKFILFLICCDFYECLLILSSLPASSSLFRYARSNRFVFFLQICAYLVSGCIHAAAVKIKVSFTKSFKWSFRTKLSDKISMNGRSFTKSFCVVSTSDKFGQAFLSHSKISLQIRAQTQRHSIQITYVIFIQILCTRQILSYKREIKTHSGAYGIGKRSVNHQSIDRRDI